ncbi:N-formylglutamate amidohydrolase [Cryomorpha ignava]|uniref:N-formylglutamate amidohydrolase n=2 Tax=Cryomorpha ignava TaxID=101383 RepID=A0A7K3WJW8_9FLAO|nr:N-formylglutamate amidohydrolase [Cryomorpha ignava]
MQKLRISEIIDNINKEQTFEAVAYDYSFTIKIADYTPYICGAVHDGHQFRKELWEKCTHSEYERWYEEDPCTKEMVQSHPIVIAGRDSRFEYDLNRDPENAIYDDAWGKKLWKQPLTDLEREQSIEKHTAFYKVIALLVAKVENIHGRAVVFDMHSFNRKRWDREIPTWNIGTGNINNERFGRIAESWREKLAEITFPERIKSGAKINDTFQGNGFFLKYITAHFKNTLVLATEIAKVYCDEETGIEFPEIVRATEQQLIKLIPQQAAEFMEMEL